MYRVSVIVPYYNNADTIHRCVRSIFEQEPDSKFQIVEVIVIDDGSSIPCPAFEDRSYSNTVLKLVRKPNGGAASARNYGLDRVDSPDFVAFLDADDAWYPEKTRLMIGEMLANNAAIAGSLSVSHTFYRSDPSQNTILVRFWDQLKTNRFLTSTTIIDVRGMEIDEIHFPEDQWYAEEGDVFLKILHGKKGILVNQVLIDYSSGKAAFGQAGASAKLWKMQAGEIRNYYRVCKRGHMSFCLLPPFLVYSFLKYIRRVLITQLKRENKRA